MPRRKRQSDDGSDVPAWIVSFSDMVTLLLAFFVLLQAFASEKSPDLFFAGRGSFLRAIHGLGIPDLLLGKRQVEREDWREIRYPMEEDPELLREQEVDDPDLDRIREIFNRLRKVSDALEARNVRGRVRNLYPTMIHFRGSSSLLSLDGQREISRVAERINSLRSLDLSKVYVFGYAPDYEDPARARVVATRRAQAVERKLREGLARPLQQDGRIESFGAAAGCWWGRRFHTTPARQHIAIVVVEE